MHTTPARKEAMTFHGRIPGESTASGDVEYTVHTTTWDRGRLARNLLADHRCFIADGTSAIPATHLLCVPFAAVGPVRSVLTLQHGIAYAVLCSRSALSSIRANANVVCIEQPLEGEGIR